jgi:hypothetical protein
LGRYHDAEAYFAEALDLTVRGGSHYFASYALVYWSELLATRGGAGDADRARDMLERARSTSVDHGYAGIERRADAALSRLS